MKGSFHSSFHGSSKLVRIQSVRIELTASGVDAPLPSGAVERNRTVTLTLAMSGSTIKLQPHWSEQRDSNTFLWIGSPGHSLYTMLATAHALMLSSLDQQRLSLVVARE